jgi:hypothetical protein
MIPNRVMLPPFVARTLPSARFVLVALVRASPALKRLDSSIMTVSQTQFSTVRICFASHGRFSGLIVVISARCEIAAARSAASPTAIAQEIA